MFLLQKATAPSWIEDNQSKLWLWTQPWTFSLKTAHTAWFLLVVIYKNKRLRRSINYFVFNMAVSDLFNPLTVMTMKIVEIISGSEFWKVDRPWLLANILCKLAYFLPDVSIVVSIGSLLLISIDRLIAVVFPLKAKLISSKVRLISILSTWFVAIAVHAPYFYNFKLIPYEN